MSTCDSNATNLYIIHLHRLMTILKLHKISLILTADKARSVVCKLKNMRVNKSAIVYASFLLEAEAAR